MLRKLRRRLCVNSFKRAGVLAVVIAVAVVGVTAGGAGCRVPRER